MMPRVARDIRCPYCRHDVWAICRRPVDHEVLHTCGRCLGVFVIRFSVTVRATALTITGESDRVADEQQELLELERSREAAEQLA